jgi:hypothetical protein
MLVTSRVGLMICREDGKVVTFHQLYELSRTHTVLRELSPGLSQPGRQAWQHTDTLILLPTGRQTGN